MLTEDSTARKLVGSLNERLYGWDVKEGVESVMNKDWAYEAYKQRKFWPWNNRNKISPESKASVDGEFSMLKEFNEKFATRESFLAFESMWLAMNPWVYLEKQAVKSTEFLLH